MSWSVILPEAGTNLVYNPNAMATGNYTAVNVATITLDTTYSYFGYKCYKVVSGVAQTFSGISFNCPAFANAIHYVSFRIHKNSTITKVPLVGVDAVDYFASALIATEGDWYVYGYQFSAAISNTHSSIIIEMNDEGSKEFYLGHIQMEQNTYPTTPITGDRRGFITNGYYWNGSPNASTSTRSAQERSGGKVVDLLTTYNFKVKYGEGSGMPPITHHTSGMALLPGALYQGHKVEPRVLDLVSATQASTVATVSAARKNFINAIKPDKVTPEQPVVFRYTDVNASKPVEFYAYYDSGMEFQLANGVVDQPVARFIAYDPFAYEVHTGGAVLSTNASLANANGVVKRINGTWSILDSTYDAAVRAMVLGSDGCVYLGGLFTCGAPDPDANYIAKWNPYTSTNSALTGGSGSGTNGAVRALAKAANGDIYLGGAFTIAGAIANTVRVAYWDVSASEFGAMSTGIDNGTVHALCFGLDGNLYIGGDFTNAGGDDEADYIAVWGGTTIDELKNGVAGADGIIYALACHPNGNIYAAGAFDNIGGIAASGMAYWNGTAWSACGAGLTGGTTTGYALTIDKAGNVYVGGNFTTADGVASLNIAKWNGKTFESLGSGITEVVYALQIDDNGIMHVGRAYPGTKSADYPDVWNGTTWAHRDITYPGTPYIYSILITGNNYYFGGDTNGTAYTSALNTITNSSSSSTYPIINFYRAEDGTTATVTYLKSETTGDILWFDYDLMKGETLKINLTPGARSITSSVYGDVWRAVLRSSDLSSFRLLPGTNYISAFVDVTGAPTITAWMEWPITHWGADMVAA